MKFPPVFHRAPVLAFGLAAAWVAAAESDTPWLPPVTEGLTITAQPDGKVRIVTPTDDVTIDSKISLPAKGGDAFAVEVRVKVGIDVNAVPELACFDTQGRELPPPVPPQSTRQSTTQWQKFAKTLVAWPGTASVRTRLRIYGRGTVLTEAPTLRPTTLDTYQTGAMITRPHPRTRAGVLLESNFGIVNRELVSAADRDGDGKWALITQDLDALTQREQKGEDWRSNFEDNPNVILWTDGAVLKSDSVTRDREPDFAHALHFRAKAHRGPYSVRLSDPGRPVAYSVDGKMWKRGKGGDEIELGTLPMTDGVIEVWIDACYADRFKTGPAYFDYVRLMPTIHEPDRARLFSAAKAKPTSLTRGKAEETAVPITLDAPSFAGERTWPVRCGLPVPRGELLSADHVAVFNAAGLKIPSQNRIMATWPDGSVQWAFMDFMHDLSAGQSANYTVAYGNRVTSMPPPGAVRVQRSAGGVEVDTGAIRFLVSGTRFGLVENVRLASGQTVQREPIRAEIVESGGRVWRALALPVARIDIEQAGPLHAVILVETKLAASGQPSEGFYHRARIHAYAGSPLVEADYFAANTDSRPAKDVGGSMTSKVVIKSFALKVRADATICSARHDAGAAAAIGARVQKAADLALAISAAQTNESKQPVRGWIGLQLADGANLHVGLADFREQFPKAFRWNPRELSIDLWAEEGGNFDWIEGVGKTHHLAFFYGSGAPVDGELLAAGSVLAAASSEWYVGSGALGDIITAAASDQPAIETNLAAHMKNPVIDRVGLGFENYGDHSSSGYVKGSPLWDNNEYDLPAGCLVHFARTGDRAALRLGLASAQHYLDVDTIHYSSQHAAWARAPHVHSHGLFGHHTAQGPDYHHAGYVQGLIWHSYFTGDPGGLAGARGIADWTARSMPILTSGMERMLGHALMTCNDVYEATGDERYLRASASFVDQALKWEHPLRSGFLSRIFETPAFYSGSPFCNGVLSAGLIKFNGWARQPEVDAMLERFARWTLTDVWISPAGLASKGGSPRKGGSPQHIGDQGRLMAYVYAKTQDPLYLVVSLNLASVGYGSNAKPIPGTRSTGLVYNYLPWLLAAGRLHGNPAPDPQLRVTATSESFTLAPGAKRVASFTVKNTGSQPMEDMRVTFHTRLDFATTTLLSPPARLLPGQAAECRYEVEAPAQNNLSCDYNSVAYGHWSALYRRADHAHLAHVPVKLVVKSPAVAPVE